MTVPFRLIANWQDKRLMCARCGERRSVKYEMHGKYYCNSCVIPASFEGRDDE